MYYLCIKRFYGFADLWAGGFPSALRYSVQVNDCQFAAADALLLHDGFQELVAGREGA